MKNIGIILMTYILLISCNSEKDNSQINDLYGAWKLISFINENNGSNINENDIENAGSIIINFEENHNFLGSTGRNEFFGTYVVDISFMVITFLEYGTSEVNETEWGSLFKNRLRLNYNSQTQNYENGFVLSNNILKIYFSENEYMKFTKQ